MKVTYIYHSSFLVETEHALLLFDYYKGTLPKLNPDKPLYVFASHQHEDHFSKAIFDLADQHRDVFFILSNDIWRKRIPQDMLEHTVFMGPGETKKMTGSSGMPEIEIKTLKSTDEGVAFFIRLDEKTIYHAGDLNDWYWEGEPQDWNDRMGLDYQCEINRLAEWSAGQPIDVAFVVLDGRQGKDYALGMDYFLQNVSAKAVFPMHFWERYRVIQDYKRLYQSERLADSVVEFRKQGECFEF